MRKWLVYGLPTAVILGSACGGDGKPAVTGDGSVLPMGCTMFIDPNTIGVGGDLTCVDPSADTDMDGIPDVREGTGDADGDGIPAHRDPDERTPLPEGGLPEGGTPPDPTFVPTATPYQVDATGEGGLDQGTIDQLKGGGACAHNVLYPYDGTIFPAGLNSPLIMVGEKIDAAYVKMTYEGLVAENGEPLLDFQWAAGGQAVADADDANKTSFAVPQEHWNEIVRRTQNTTLNVKITVKMGGTVSACDFGWKVAPGTMIGSIYYNTYNHPEANGVGAVMRLRLGENQANVYQTSLGTPPTGPCRSCHSVSADGSTLVSNEHFYAPLAASFGSDSYDLGDTPNPPLKSELENATFGGLTPNGEKILTIGNPDCTGGADTFPRSRNNFPLVEGPDHARLLNTATGQDLGAKGLNADWYMWMPQFSPDGDKVVFNHAKPGGDGTDRTTLAFMTFDDATNTFGAPEVLATQAMLTPSVTFSDYSPMSGSPGGIVTLLNGNDGCSAGAGVAALPGGTCSGPCYPAWPFFTPDGNGVIFAMVSEPDFMSAMPGRVVPSKSELWYVDLRDGAYVRLDKANAGLAPGDSLLNYFPTVLPVQVGGYYWVFWTSTRPWGHKEFLSLTLAFDESYIEAVKKRIWVSAIRPRVSSGSELGLPPLMDPSSPPFYLEGQSNTGNVRAFAALNPCLESGNTCTSGLDCCSGYCMIANGEESGVCADEPPECAKVNERCDDSVPCCDSMGKVPANPDDALPCIGGYCGVLIN